MTIEELMAACAEAARREEREACAQICTSAARAEPSRGEWPFFPATAGLSPEQREQLGREVRDEWIAWAREQPAPKPSWLTPWELLEEPDREVDRRIGERLFWGGARTAAKIALVAVGHIIKQQGGQQ